MKNIKESPNEIENDKSFLWNRRWIFICGMILAFLYMALAPSSKPINVMILVLLCGIYGYNEYKIQHLFLQRHLNKIKRILPEDIRIPANMPLPYVILGKQKNIILYNEAFAAIFPQKNLEQADFANLLQEYKPNVFWQIVAIGDTAYEIYSQKSEVWDSSKNETIEVYSLCFVSQAEKKLLKQSIEEQKTVVGLLFLDNYEEVVDSLDESRLPLLTAMIDRKLNSLAVSVGGIIKKFEKDRYIFLLSRGKLEELKEKKFEILNEIRELSVGDHIPVTISIGIGIGDESLELAHKNARAAMDLALGRGGDQVLIKTGEKYLFYGGKSGEVGHNARIRARVKADALWELIGGATDVLVMGHKQADFDSLGAAMGICPIARTMGKPCHIVLNTVSAGIDSLYNKIIHTEGYEKLFVTGEEASSLLTDKTLLIITDTHRYSMTEHPPLIDRAKKVVLFDHHRKSTDFIDNAVLIYHEPYASSTCELITEMIQYFGEKIKLKPIEADALLAGITVDTKNFCMKTGAITFEAAAFLRRNGGDSIRVRKLFQNDILSYKIRAAIVKNAEIFQDKFAISVCEEEGEDALLVTAQAADELLNIKGVTASFVCCPKGDTIYISARSFGEINVQLIMEKLGGGGHLSVSGAQVHSTSIEEVTTQLKNAIEQYIEEDN
jgi:c-di-AMP phosphodiesterase-like protein